MNIDKIIKIIEENMSNYSDKPAMCRVDIFKPSGKWYETLPVLFRNTDYYNPSIHDALKNALVDSGRTIDNKFIIICLKPYHNLSHPICIKKNGYTC